MLFLSKPQQNTRIHVLYDGQQQHSDALLESLQQQLDWACLDFYDCHTCLPEYLQHARCVLVALVDDGQQTLQHSWDAMAPCLLSISLAKKCVAYCAFSTAQQQGIEFLQQLGQLQEALHDRGAHLLGHYQTAHYDERMALNLVALWQAPIAQQWLTEVKRSVQTGVTDTPAVPSLTARHRTGVRKGFLGGFRPIRGWAFH